MTFQATPEKGRFITFEGGEGVGKSTQLARLAEHLRDCGFEVVTTREPGGTAKAEKLRAFLLSGRAAPLGPLAEAALFSAARADHVETLIAPALKHGAWVLCDRFADSTRAYQGARGGVDAKNSGAARKSGGRRYAAGSDDHARPSGARRPHAGRRRGGMAKRSIVSKAKRRPFMRICGRPSSTSPRASRNAAA